MRQVIQFAADKRHALLKFASLEGEKGGVPNGLIFDARDPIGSMLTRLAAPDVSRDSFLPT
jgi:hypothetical protein